jgi:hypothetical protein
MTEEEIPMRREKPVLLLTMGSAMLISSSVALAAPPISYGQYTASGGTITTGAVSSGTFTGGNCPTNFSCGTEITGDGFMQRQLTDTITGEVYFQTVILEKGSDVPSQDGSAGQTDTGYAYLADTKFADESFVKQGGGTGIADTSHVLAQPTISAADQSTFTGDTAINVGWAKTAPEDLIDVHQVISDPSKTSVDFRLTDSSTDNTLPVITLQETVWMPATGETVTSTTDRQVFYLKQLKSDADSTTATQLELLPQNTGDPTQTLTYLTDDIMQGMWLGQQVAGASFGTISYTRNPNPDSANPPPSSSATISYSDQSTTGPSFGAAPEANWNDTFFNSDGSPVPTFDVTP